MEENFCKNCKFSRWKWVKEGESRRQLFLCLRYPNAEIKKQDDWCGEFKYEEE